MGPITIPRAIGARLTRRPGAATLSPGVIGRIGASVVAWLGVELYLTTLPTPLAGAASALLWMAVAAGVAGAAMWLVPWRRLPVWTTLLAVPPVCGLLGAAGALDPAGARIVPGFSVALFAWIGLGHRRGTTLALAPLLAAALVVPHIGAAPGTWVASTIGLVLLCIAFGEALSWVTARLQHYEELVLANGKRSQSLIARAGELVTLLDADFRITYENDAAMAVLGYLDGARVGKPFVDYVNPEDRVPLSSLFQTLTAMPGRIERTEVRIRHADGTYRWCALSLRNLLRDPSLGVVMVHTSDVTRRRLEDVRLAASESDFRTLFSANPQPMFVYDRNTLQFLEVNQVAVDHYGYTREEFFDMTLPMIWESNELSHLEDLPAGDRGEPRETWRHVLRDGRTIIVEAASHDLVFRGHEAVLVAIKDITEQKALEDQLISQAFQDPLTGLPNRALFRERVQHALVGRTSGEASVLFIDLDRFKTVNDSLGHSAGDELLVAVAQRVLRVLRAEDTLARLGGDEFAVLVERANGGGETAAVRVLDALRAPFAVGGADVLVAASIGVASAIEGSADDLLRNADMAMYRAKAGGRNRYEIYDPQLQQGARNRLRLETDLVHAIDRNQLTALYQPVVALDTEQIVGAEALLRWEHPDIGVISPTKFVPIAEETGLIVPLGNWVLYEACLRASEWHMARPDHPPLSIAVNVSVRQLQESNFVDEVERALRECCLQPSRLTLEITENVFMEETESIVGRLDQLKELGVQLAIDDFGTGYSSLAYLSQLPIDTLKIDRAFTAMIERLEDVPPLIEGLVHLGKQLNLKMVAEGIEDVQQLEQLRSLGCSHGQGFIWSRPVEWDVFTALVERQGARRRGLEAPLPALVVPSIVAPG